MDELKLGKLTYLVKYPEGFSKNGKYPVLFFLHGAVFINFNRELTKNQAFFIAERGLVCYNESTKIG